MHNYFTTEILVELERNSQINMNEKTQYLIDLIKEEGADNITVRPILVSGDPEEEHQFQRAGKWQCQTPVNAAETGKLQCQHGADTLTTA